MILIFIMKHKKDDILIILMQIAQRKYPFIEVMSYLECSHAQVLLHRLQKMFRHKLIIYQELINNNQKSKVKEQSKTIYMQYFTSDPSSLYVKKIVLIDLKTFCYKNIKLKIDLRVNDEEEVISSRLKKFVNGMQFGSLLINIFTSNEILRNDYRSIFEILDKCFARSQYIEYNINIQWQKDIKMFSLSIFNNKTIKNLIVDSYDKLYFRVKLLQNIKHLQIIANDGTHFQFENLDILYPETKFTVQFMAPQINNVRLFCQQYPSLFSTQKCNIIFQYYHKKLKLFLQQFDKNKVILNELKIQHKDDFVKILELQSKHKNFSLLNVYLNANVNLVDINGQLKARTLIIEQTSQIINIKNLQKFKISSTIEIIINANSIIAETQSRSICPEKLTITVMKGKQNWEKYVLDILNGLCKFQNTKSIHFYSLDKSPMNISSLCKIYSKLKVFTNVRELRLPFSCDKQANQSMMELLKQLKWLFHLDIWSYEESRKIQDVVHEFSQFVIDQLKEVVTLNIKVFQVIEMREIQYSHRASKLTISVIYGNSSITQHIVDTRLGQRNYILQSASL